MLWHVACSPSMLNIILWNLRNQIQHSYNVVWHLFVYDDMDLTNSLVNSLFVIILLCHNCRPLVSHFSVSFLFFRNIFKIFLKLFFYPMITVFMCDRCGRNLATLIPAKYESDSTIQQLCFKFANIPSGGVRQRNYSDSNPWYDQNPIFDPFNFPEAPYKNT